jgi:hypothetical protein
LVSLNYMEVTKNMSRDIMELENIGELLKLYDGNEKDEIICITSFTDDVQEGARKRVRIVITSEPANTNILVKVQEYAGTFDLPYDSPELDAINQKRQEIIDTLKLKVEKRKAELFDLLVKKGFRVLFGAWMNES